MSYSSFIARRFLRSQHHQGFLSFISNIAILGVTLGVAALIITLSVLGGFERELTSKVIGFTSHIQVYGFQSQPLGNVAENIRTIEAHPLVKSVSPFAAREALIRSRDGVDGILLKGLDSGRDVSDVSRYLVEGEFSIDRIAGSLPKVIIGRKLSQTLSLGVGDKVTVFGMTRLSEGGQTRARQFIVSGIYESGMAEYDDVYVFTSLKDAQIVFQLGDDITGYDVLVTNLDSMVTVSEYLKKSLGYPHHARTVFETYRNLFTWIELQKRPVPIILSLIITVATVNIIGTLLMMVLEKTRDIGVLKAMGATKWGVGSIFLRQGLTIGITGTFFGNIIAFVLCYAQMSFRFFSLPSDIYFMSTVPIQLDVFDFLLVSGATITLCLITAFIPARFAARLQPVNAIRFG